MKPRILSQTVIRPSAADLVRAVTPPATQPPTRSKPLPAYDPHDPELEPETTRIPTQRQRPDLNPQAGPGPDRCRFCWCEEKHHLSGYNGKVGPCKRLGCDTDCPGFKKPRRWIRAVVRSVAWLFAVALAWLCIVVVAFWVGAFIGAQR